MGRREKPTKPETPQKKPNQHTTKKKKTSTANHAHAHQTDDDSKEKQKQTGKLQNGQQTKPELTYTPTERTGGRAPRK